VQSAPPYLEAVAQRAVASVQRACIALRLGVPAQLEFESKIEAKLKAVHHILVSSA